MIAHTAYSTESELSTRKKVSSKEKRTDVSKSRDLNTADVGFGLVRIKTSIDNSLERWRR